MRKTLEASNNFVWDISTAVVVVVYVRVFFLKQSIFITFFSSLENQKEPKKKRQIRQQKRRSNGTECRRRKVLLMSWSGFLGWSWVSATATLDCVEQPRVNGNATHRCIRSFISLSLSLLSPSLVCFLLPWKMYALVLWGVYDL